ncbi:OmpA family protein [Streptomyces bathyalis]|uniref:OmpA family protein n=1 Tax=Streptomyces bathyalis TaxID=2710756 RepID=A0A7T1TCX8_9ACTN|nr:OmpA family protein [Streptomyces bathyalis]QPP10594.1 OmpA family protein [Streptomyces bathyalis]
MRLPAAHVLRTVLCTSASAVLLTTFCASGARADDPTPKPTVKVPSGPTSLPGADDPTTIPTTAPSLPGEGGAPAPDYSEPPDNIGDSKPPVKVDPQAAGLKLADGAKLAPSRVLDIKFVTEDLSGEERREDSTGKTKFTLQAEVLFPKDSSKLDSSAQSRIQEIADEIDSQQANEINVFGFTDDLGSYEHGKALSKKRANAVQKALAEELNSTITFNVRGYSEDYPIADNSSEEGRKKNRRVEVSFPRQG